MQEVEQVVGILARRVESDEEVNVAVPLGDLLQTFAELSIAGGGFDELQFAGGGLQIVA